MRLYQDDGDLETLARFLVRARSMGGDCGFYHLGDLYWNLYLAELRGDIPENLALWEDASGALQGFAWYYPPDGVDLQAAPWADAREALETEMIEWALRRRMTFSAPDGETPRLATEVFENDTRRSTLLEGLGFGRDADYKLHMRWDLTEPVPHASLPEGFTVRGVAGPEEIPARVAVQREVWPHSRLRPENYPRLQSMPGYDRELDLVCVAPDGTFAAFGICWLDAKNRVGEFEPVGTHPAYQRRGLGKALMYEGLRRLQERGATRALVYPTGGDEPAERLYASAGFVPIQRQFNYSRTVAGHE